MRNWIPKPGEICRHFKNKLYQVMAVAEHTETGEAMVVYQALYGDFRVYVRPLEMFVSQVDRDKYPGAAQTYRFEPVDRGSLAQEAPFRGERAEAERRSRLETWKESGREEEWKEIEDEISELEDLGGRDGSPAGETEVIPREGRAEREEDELWASLTDEAVQAAGEETEEAVNPRFLDFLEARSYESKAVILESMKEELDDEMIDGLAMAIDVEIPAGPMEERYHQLHQCLETMARYESSRLR